MTNYYLAISKAVAGFARIQKTATSPKFLQYLHLLRVNFVTEFLKIQLRESVSSQRFAILAALLLQCSFACLNQIYAQEAAPVPLIYDTDIGNDVDDVLALGIIHALESRGACELLAVTITKDNPLAGRFVDCINTFYGRGEIPIGIVEDGVTPNEGKFIGLAEERDGNDYRYPHDFNPENSENATRVLRRTLAAANDESVVIAQVGFSTNLARLLESPADDVSPLTGKDLVKQKVRLLSMMAGSFDRYATPPGKYRDHREYNVVKDLPAAKKLASEWPTPVVWSGYEIGQAVLYPSESIERDYGYVDHHPLAEAYYLYNPPPHDRPTWDLTSVLYAVQPDHEYFNLSAPGTIAIADDGLTSFDEKAGGRDRYLIVTPEQCIRVTEALVQLSSQPPAARE